MSSNLEELDGLYVTILVTEVVNRSINCALAWTQVAPSIYTATWTYQSVLYDLSFTQMSGFWVLNFSVEGSGSLSVSSSEQSDLNDLAYQLTRGSTSFGQLIRGIRGTKSCDSVYTERGKAGVRVGGKKTKYNKQSILSGSAGVQLAGESIVKSGFYARGGTLAGGQALVGYTANPQITGSVLAGGGELPNLLYTLGGRSSGNQILFGLYSFSVLGTGFNTLFETPSNSEGTIAAWDVDYVGGKIYEAEDHIGSPFGLKIYRRDLDYSNRQLLFTVNGGSTSGGGPPNLRYDRFSNLLWMNFVDLYRFNLTTNTFSVYHAFNSNNTLTNTGFHQDVSVFSDAVYVLNYPQPLNRYSKSGILVSSVRFQTLYNVSIFCMAEDYANDVLWVGGNFGSPIASPIGTSFIGKFSRDLGTFSIVYSAFDPDLVIGIVIDNTSHVGYATCGFQNSGTKLHKFNLDGSGSSLVNSWGSQPSDYGLRIYVRP
jgi:hypothetical protein